MSGLDLFPRQLAPDAVTGLGTAMAGGKGKLNLAKTARTPLDYYPTPPEATRALWLAEREHIARHGARAWEPCGRGGAIARILQAAGLHVTASDIVPDPANAVVAGDIFVFGEAPAPIAITNPPFAHAGRIIDHLLGRLHVPYLALLLKTTFFSTDTADRGHVARFATYRPSMRWDMTWRVDFTGGGNSTMNCSWFIWDMLRPPTDPLGWGLLQRDGPVRARADLFNQEERHERI
jgi:hypothetical protein